MIKKPDKEKPGVFSFMYPLSNTVWLCVMVAFVAVSLVLFLVGRWSPYEWTKLDLKDGTPINNFNILNTFWFSLGALMQQGSDTFPRLVRVLSKQIFCSRNIVTIIMSIHRYKICTELPAQLQQISLRNGIKCFQTNVSKSLYYSDYFLIFISENHVF